MERYLYSKLLAWKQDPRRKPLVLEGARQVGKTHLLTEFGRRVYEDLAYFNFEEESGLASLFAEHLDPEQLVQRLSVYRERTIHPDKTLIFFDEIQESESALTSLKYFHEQANYYHVVSAGSLLGIKRQQIHGFPVGQVNFLTLYPVSFFEFLDAVGKTALRTLLNKKKDTEALPETFHRELIEWLRKYYYIGGMPEVLQSYLEGHDFERVRRIQKEILKSFTYDFAKHAPGSMIPKIQEIWDSLPVQLARENKKFTYSTIKKNARAREYDGALQWLADAGLIQKCFAISRPGLPLSGYAEEHYFKVYLLDVGLLGALYDLSSKTMVEESTLFTHFKGALVESYVAQELRHRGQALYYWTSRGIAEIDFVASESEKIFPLEVKAGTNIRSKSLQVFREKYGVAPLAQSSLLNFQQKKQIINYPLYAVTLFPSLQF